MLTATQRNRLINLIRTYRVSFTHEFVMESLQGVSDSFEEIVRETYELLDVPVAENEQAIQGILRLLTILRHVDDRRTLLAALDRVAHHDSENIKEQVVTLSSFLLQHDAQMLSERQQQMLNNLAKDR